MALALPDPAPAAAGSGAPERAYQIWQSAQRRARLEQWDGAATDFDRAFRTHPDDAYGLAAVHALICAGQSVLATDRARSLRRRQPALLLAYTLESHALLERGLAAEAADALLALPSGAPRDRAYWSALGISLQRCRRDDEAIGAFMKALAIKMDDAVLHFHLGMSFKDKGMKAEAAECVRTALLLGLGDSELAARGQLAFLEREACRWEQAEIEMQKLSAAVKTAPDDRPVETGAFSCAVLGEDPFEQLKVARLYALRVASFVNPLPRRAACAHQGRLRIAYLSSDFHSHATSQLMVQMLESHDRSRFEVTLVSAGPDDCSEMRKRIVASSEHFEELRGKSPAIIARRIRDLKIDILVDLKGATYGSLMPVTAHRPAPLQVNWLGFPGTTGAPYIDYLIGDQVVTPLTSADQYSEKIAQLPHCYQPNDSRRALVLESNRADWGLASDQLVLCAFHQSYKISAVVFDRWCEILERLPNSVLWLLLWNTNVQSALLAAARARGIADERLLFAPLVSTEQHLQRLACADLYLDTWPCNAHTTAGEALWVGVPVVTLIGPTFAQRVAASLLTTIGMSELVCDDQAQYVDTVVALATDADRRAELGARLVQARGTSPLFDGEGFARDIEALYLRMWERAAAGLPPSHLAAS